METKGLQERVFDHLGTKTWFWKVKITKQRNSVEAVIVCVPAAGDDTAESWIGHDYSYRLYSFSIKTRE